MKRTPVRVIKVGGSLMDYEHLAGSFRSWLAAQPEAFNVLIAGGGAMADVIRQADSRYRLGEETSHWLCIDLLSVTARLLHAVLPETALIETFDALNQATSECNSDAPAIFSPTEYLREFDGKVHRQPLPHNWTVTTDSIAARIADVIDADELVLLKSTDPAEDDPTREALVDGYFRRSLPAALPLRIVNLRSVECGGRTAR